MKTRSKLFAGLALGGALAAGAVMVAPANAAVGCPTGWTEPVTGICQYVVTTGGTIEIPTGAGTVSAVLVGGGGGGAGTSTTNAAGGASGEVLYIDDVVASPDGTVFVGVGVGGEGSTGEGAGGTGSILIDANGPHTTPAVGGGITGNSGANLGGSNDDFFGVMAGMPSAVGGAGANGDASGNDGGVGFMSLAEIPGIDTTIWPDDAASDSSVFTGVLAWGGVGQTEYGLADAAYGSGGYGWSTSFSGPTAGKNGIVVLRMAAFEQGGGSTPTPNSESLASTGANVTGLGAIAGLALLAGAVAFVARRRSRSEA